jgi:hypothetical protein
MHNTEFASWLAGFFLITGKASLTEDQRLCIANHSKLCEYTEEKCLTLTNHTLRHHLAELTDEQIRELAVDQFEALPVLQGHDIVYFLQGAFEIGDVWEVPSEVVMEQMSRNVHGLLPVLINLYSRCQEAGGEVVDATELREDLQKTFLHVIDPGYQYDPETADAIHRGLST